MRGTSMSCPHAVGIVTLLLQVDPTLDPDGVRAILARTAATDEHTTTEQPNPTWGYGKIDAWEAVAFALGVGVCDDDEECAQGYRCGDEGRCQEKKAGGCACAQRGATPGGVWPVLLVLIGILRRKR